MCARRVSWTERQERDTNLPNAISSDDWNSLLAHAKSKTLTALREPIRTAAKKTQVLVQGKKKQHIAMTFWLLPSIRAHNNRFILKLYSLYSSLSDLIYLIPDANSWFWKMQPLWDRERRRKIRERFAKGGSWELLFSTTCIFIYIYIYTYKYLYTVHCTHTHTHGFYSGYKKGWENIWVHI